MKIKFKKTYISPTSEAVEVATNGVLCQSLDGVTMTRSGYGENSEQSWSDVGY